MTAVVERIRRSACGTVAWTGFASSIASVRTALTQGGLASIDVVGADPMKADAYLSETDGAGDGTIVTCACADLASSTRPEAGRFIHDFQSRFGSPPGAFAAEGWDVGGMLIAAFATGATDRETVAAALAAAPPYEGLANTYRFSEEGELEPGSVRMHTYRAEGLRWVPLGESRDDGSLPVGTPGYLSVASCRSGPPFAYSAGDRLQGFDVELAAAIARRLGLTVAWSDLPCGSALAAVSAGTLDAVLAPAASVAQGTPMSGVALSLRVALVAKRTSANGDRPLLDRLGPEDVVAVVGSPEAVGWAKDVLRATGARLRIVTRRADAYAGLRVGPVRGARRPGALGVGGDRATARTDGRAEPRRRRPRRPRGEGAGRDPGGSARSRAQQAPAERPVRAAVREVLPGDTHPRRDRAPSRGSLRPPLDCPARGTPI